MTPTYENIYLVYKKKFEETGDLGVKEVMDKYKKLFDEEPVKVVEEIEVDLFRIDEDL